ncbi:MAG: hypothetical protein ACOCP8_04960 [archaeon]
MNKYNFSKHFDIDKGYLKTDFILNDILTKKEKKKIEKKLGKNVFGRTSNEIRKKCKISKEKSEKLEKIGEELFNFYCKKFNKGWHIHPIILKQIGIIHKKQQNLIDDTEYLKNILLLKSPLNGKKEEISKKIIRQYYDNIIKLAYPPQAIYRSKKIMNNIDNIYEFMVKKDKDKVKYVGEQIKLVLNRATKIMFYYPLGQIILKENKEKYLKQLKKED